MLRNTNDLPETVGATVPFDGVSHRTSRDGAPGTRGVPIPRANVRVAISPSETVERLSMQGRGIVVELVQATGRIEFCYRGSSHLLVAYEQGVRREDETPVDGKPPSNHRDLTRKLRFVPAGHDYMERHQLHASGRILNVYLDPAMLEVQTGSGGAAPLGARQLFEDAALRSTVAKLKSLIESPRSESSAYLEALGAVLMHELVRSNGATGNGEGLARGGLAAWQQRLVSAYIDEHLSENIALATLAGLARLSPYHFSRAFKQSFGVPPHRYHTNRRIERAKALLEGHVLSVTEIGMRLGFSETSSFTAAFRKTTGLTPSRYHRSVPHLAPG